MSGSPFRFGGAEATLSAGDRRALMERILPAGSAEPDGAEPDAAGVRTATAAVIAEVRATGDAALRELAVRFGGTAPRSLEVPRAEWRAALERLPTPVADALRRAARNIETAHRAWAPVAATVETEPGVRLERRPHPIERVGVYAPGGRAVYPSSVLMGVVPARVAGVREILVCSPAGPNGAPADAILAAAELAGAHRVFAVGGAQAIAALAFGTESVPRVDRIVGPGNAYVMEAKLQVSDRVGIDGPAGPSEILIVADSSTRPSLVAAEVIAQAEHDPRAAVVVLVIGDATAAKAIETAVVNALASAERRSIGEVALGGLGALLTVPDVESAATFANRFAAEHLLLAFDGADRAVERFPVAGSVFVGATSSVTFGDYLTGANHVLPTSGLARSYSGLGPDDFIRWTSYQRITPDAARRLAGDTATLALAEGLPGHAAAARLQEGA